MSEVLTRRSEVEGAIKKSTLISVIDLTTGLVQTAKAKKQAKKILAGIHEAEKIHAGKKQGQSFDDFLTEL